jgi:phospholipid-binding lipoprotein MlaA
MPATAVNQVLQGHPGDSVQSLGRFAVNTTIGIAGVFDPASHFGMPRLSPIGHVQDSGTAGGLQVLEIVDMRTRMLPVDEFRRNALDDYIFVRDAWSQRRNSQIQQDLRSNRD